MLENTIEESLPPNPKELVNTLDKTILSINFLSGSISISFMGLLKFMFGGIKLCFKASIDITDYITPAAPSV